MCVDDWSTISASWLTDCSHWLCVSHWAHSYSCCCCCYAVSTLLTHTLPCCHQCRLSPMDARVSPTQKRRQKGATVGWASSSPICQCLLATLSVIEERLVPKFWWRQKCTIYRLICPKTRHLETPLQKQDFFSGKGLHSLWGWGYPFPTPPSFCALIQPFQKFSLTPLATILTTWSTAVEYVLRLLLLPRRGAKYCDEYVCLSVCLSTRTTTQRNAPYLGSVS